MRPVTTARLRVLRISASISRSQYWLIACAPPAASVPPSMVANISPSSGLPGACCAPAMSIEATVGTSNNGITRGFIRPTYSWRVPSL